ncbi:MAG: LON peptidase substrate-binding domain-containing protein [Candidatus Melainabacteria bacterium]|jgi:ATP-dependent Lon protease|nr:LON peptidase substrate-binding domain-containing protein [Candidatus Melainabacteria bacterium]
MHSPSSVSLCELPLFPLPDVVLFPGRPLPLHIFEDRYRLMINTVLENDRKFGVMLWNPTRSGSVNVGCAAQIGEVVRLKDGRMNIMTVGIQRFRVVEIVKQLPYLVGKVEWLEDSTPDSEATYVGCMVDKALRDVVSLANKLTHKENLMPDDMPSDPVLLSYWVASLFFNSSNDRQELLELCNTGERLRKELTLLDSLKAELAARAAIEDAFRRH